MAVGDSDFYYFGSDSELKPSIIMPLLRFSSRSKKKTTESDSDQQLMSQKQPDSPTGNLPGPGDFKAEALLAFRTITTMLSLLQSTIGDDPPDEPSQANSRKTLSVLNALAAIVTREHGVAAVVSSVSLEDIEVVICAIHNGEPLTISQRSSGRVVDVVKEFVLSFIATQNPRYSTLGGPIISDPEAMVVKHLKKHANEGHGLLVHFLMNCW